MSDRPEFTIDVYQNEYLPEDGREVNAIVTVEAAGGPLTGTARSARAAEVIIIDSSGSMVGPGPKMQSAKQATRTAIDGIRDGVHFAVVQGSNVAAMVYPDDGRMVEANAQTRTKAKAAVDRVRPAGGTAIGSWLRLAKRLFTGHEHAIRHAILLTDGKNQHETPEELDAALAACAGAFVCDCRGVGTDWEVAELRKVASAMLGTVEFIPDPVGLEADFRAMTEAAMGKSVGDVALRLWTPRGANLRFIKQVLPTVEDLTGRRTAAGAQVGDYPTGSWGRESRDYHVCVEVPVADVGQEMLAARVSLVAAGGADGADASAAPLASGLIKAIWTSDAALSTQINPQVAHYTGQAELAQAIQEGLQARKDGDLEAATLRLGRAVALAGASGNAAISALLDRVVDVVDPATGTVRLKKHVNEADEMALDTRSTRTVRVRKGDA
jgi:hypothetical protein